MAEAEAAPELTVGTTVGNYRVEQKIGEGGMGAVYLAEHPLLGRKAAVKVLLNQHSKRPDVVTRFFNEAKTAASLKHPALVEVFDFGFLPDGAGYIIMEYLDGESLAARLARVAPLPPEVAAEIGRQLAAGVYAAHEQGIVHRDLKPDNIYLVPDPEQPGRERVKILDFGIAKLMMPSALGSKGATTTGMLLGTPLYMAPEQCRGSGQVDHRADIYSVGCILYLMLTGKPPFDYEGVGEILAAHLHEPVKSPRTIDPTLPEQLELIVMRALAKKPEDRYPNVSELGADLQRFVLGPTGPARPGVTPASAFSSSGRLSGVARASGGARAASGGAAPIPAVTPARGSARVPVATPVTAVDNLVAPGDASPSPASPASPPARRLPDPAPLGGGRGALMVLGLVLVAVAAGGALWFKLRPDPSAPVATTPAAVDQPAPPASAPAPTPPPAAPEVPPGPVGKAEPEPTESTGAPAVVAGSEGDQPAPATDHHPSVPPAGAEAETEAETAPASPGTGTATGEGDSPPAPGKRRPAAPRPVRVSAGERLFDRAMEHRSRGEEAEALLTFRAALKAEGLEGEKRAEAQRQQLLLRPKFGELEVESAVDGVKVSLDGRFQGSTPLAAPLLVRPGNHVLTLSHPRYRTVTRKVTIAAKEKLPVRFEY